MNLEEVTKLIQKINSNRANVIIEAVNEGTPKIQILFLNEDEEKLFEQLMDEVTFHVEEGECPIFEFVEN